MEKFGSKISTVAEGGEGTPRHAPSIQRIRALFGEKSETEQQQFQQSHSEVLREGWLHCKVTAVDGKKSVDRSWRNVYVVLTCDSLNAFKDKKLATASAASESNFEEWPQIILSESDVEIAEDYTKKKYVFRLKTEAGSEALFQAESEVGLQQWVQSVEAAIGVREKPPASTNQRKLTSITPSNRNRSPTGQSPATKNRKPSSDQGPMNKEHSKKTWKGKVAKQWKRMQGSTPVQNASYPEGGSIGVPLEECPMSDLECVPLLVRTCCRIVEEKGLDIVGIYRVPGNAAAVNNLTEQVNSRGEEVFAKQDDPKWNDVNIVTSLLKSFFRKLPDPIFTMEMYGVFIEASKVEEANKRLNALRKLIRELPEVNFDTLHHICGHLVKVMEHCDTNKMEIRNLAIVFGPTLVRPADDNMLSMVTDMSHQCRIIESILSNFEWFFNDDEDLDEDEANDLEAHASTPNNNMDLVKLMDSGQTESNHGLLLSNLQKLEDSGKISSASAKDVSAKDIVSGIISAANRKMLRSQNKTSSSSNKKDSVESSKKLDTASLSSAASRRNSESVFHGAVAIAAAVPQLMVNAGNSMSTSNLVTSTASQENLINVESTMMSSSTSRIVSTVGYDESGFKEDSTGKKVKYPIETYQGLEKATAERVRRFVDETRANLMRGRPDSSPNLNVNRTTTDAHVENWTDDLAGGILFQDDPYPPHAFNERLQTQDRFVNLTYRSPSVTKTPDRVLRPPAAMMYHHRPGVLTRGLSLGELSSQHQSPQKYHHHHQPLTPFEFDTKKIASHDTLKRLKLVKSPTDTQLFVPNQLPNIVPPPEPSNVSDSMLTSLTADFDEKMKLLLDPNYSGGSQSDSSSVQSTPSRLASSNFRRVSEINPNKVGNGKNCRSISLGEDSQKVCNEKQLSILNEQQKNSKKSELKRGRQVDKHHQPKLRPLNDSETEKPSSGRLKAKNRRLRRRHTVGGTKDFADLEIETAVESEPELPMCNNDDIEAIEASSSSSHFDPTSYHQSVMMNVNRSLGQWIMRQKKMGKSSPDLSLIGRRLSLPDSVLATSAAFYPFTSLLESQV